MIKDITVEASLRDARGKNEARRLRRQGRIPAVLYGERKDSIPVSLNAKQISQILHSAAGHNTIFQVALANGAREAAMLVDWQFDPLKGNLLHTDLQRIDLTRSLRVKVPIATQGDARGVKTQGGLLEIVTREVEVECLPANIPDHIVVDVTELELGQAVRVRNLAASDRYRVTSDPEKILAHVILLKHEEEKPAEVVAEGEAAPAEPEVIKKGKQVEEGAEAEAPPKEAKAAKEGKEGKEKGKK
ncbi:MAG: 50S ribosomal protein L25 [Acidobacteria bacterium]|nr:50S ribosomal protein L25 [Acidobacteriota bacterium]